MRRSIALVLATACGSTAIVEVPVEDGAAGAPSAATPFDGAPSSAGSTSSASGGALPATGGVGSGGAPIASSGTSGASGGAQGVAGAAGSASTAAPDRALTYYEPPPGYCAVFRGERMVILEWFPKGGWQLQATEYECYSSGNPVRAFGALSRSDEPADGTWANGATICRKCWCEADSTWWQGVAAPE